MPPKRKPKKKNAKKLSISSDQSNSIFLIDPMVRVLFYLVIDMIMKTSAQLEPSAK